MIANPFDTLSSIILHLIQSGVKIELNYDLINNFISNNPTTKNEEVFDISQKEKKFIDQYVGDIVSSYNFDY